MSMTAPGADPRALLAARRDSAPDVDVARMAGQLSQLRDRYRADQQRLLEHALRKFFAARPSLREVDWVISNGSSNGRGCKGGNQDTLVDLADLLAGVDHHAIAGLRPCKVSAGRDGRLQVIYDR